MITASLTITAFRGYDDDAVEGSATLKNASTPYNWTQNVDENFRCRLVVAETAGGASNNVAFQWQYNLNGGGWNNITTTSSVVKAVSSIYITDGADTTQQVGTGGTFVADNDGFTETGSITGVADFVGNDETETEAALQIVSTDVANNDTVQLRVLIGGNAPAGTPTLPSITVSESTPDALTANDITTGSPAVGSPTIGQTHALTATGVTTGSPAVGSPDIGQEHALTATGITTAAPDLGTPTIQVVTPLTANDVTAGAPDVGSPSIGQVHALTATDTASGAPAVGSPTFGQIHALAASDAVTGAPSLGTPTLAQSAGTDALTASDITTGAASLGTPTLGLSGICSWTADTIEVTADDTTATADGSCISGEECTWTADSTYVTADGTAQTADGLDRACAGETPEPEEAPFNLGLSDPDETWMLRQDDEIIMGVIRKFVESRA